jgi:phage terminase large subunit-like protein
LDNPHISKEAVEEIAQDMTRVAYLQEIMAEDIDEAPGAIFKRKDIDEGRRNKVPELSRVVVGVDPSGSSSGNEAGILVAGEARGEYYILGDYSLQTSPHGWASESVRGYNIHQANVIVAENNFGGEMVEEVILNADPKVPVKLVTASRGKQIRAEPIGVLYEKGKVHHVGVFDELESEMTIWEPGDPSPNRMDALVWALTELSGGAGLSNWESVQGLGRVEEYTSPWA